VLERGVVLVLPSLYEPLFVVVHEHARAACPMVFGYALGAAERFLKVGALVLVY